jgi:hypothetical protein
MILTPIFNCYLIWRCSLYKSINDNKETVTAADLSNIYHDACFVFDVLGLEEDEGYLIVALTN